MIDLFEKRIECTLVAKTDTIPEHVSGHRVLWRHSLQLAEIFSMRARPPEQIGHAAVLDRLGVGDPDRFEALLARGRHFSFAIPQRLEIYASLEIEIDAGRCRTIRTHGDSA